MTYQFRPAIREQTSVLVAFAGASGSGKTYSALKFARGLVGPEGRIGVIDTEGGRALHYADMFKFDHLDMHPPFSPDRYREAIAAGEDFMVDALVIDSMSHEYDGEGGILEWADKEADSGVKTPGNWKVPKGAHKKFMSRLIQCRCHLVICLRAEEKMLIEKYKDDRGYTKTRVIAAQDRPLLERWAPICEKRFMFEMTASFLLLPSAPGIPQAIKLQDQHRPFFPVDKPIDESCGAALAEWARGGAVPVGESAGASAEPGPPSADKAAAFFARASYAISPVAALSGNENWPAWDKKMRKIADNADNAAQVDQLVADNAGHMSSYNERQPDAAGALAQYIEDVRRILEVAEDADAEAEGDPLAMEGAAP